MSEIIYSEVYMKVSSYIDWIERILKYKKKFVVVNVVVNLYIYYIAKQDLKRW